jgi:hypothetical protein
MSVSNERLYPGDLVEVRMPDEILRTLDEEGTSRHLPFMPEMVEFCGRRFRVSKRVLKTCISGPVATILAFSPDDVVLLEGLRCSGAAHDGCQKACTIFWREAWLRKVDDSAVSTNTQAGGREQLQSRLKTTRGERYFCQASELLKAAKPLSRWQRLGTCIEDVRAGNTGPFEMVRLIGIWLLWRIRRQFLGPYARGNQKTTPTGSLNLQPGEVVDVKSIGDIRDTLNARACNRGLSFFPNMRLLCGGRSRVRNRLDRFIVDGTGEMRQQHNTVYLEGSMCGCAHVAFGGCPRGEFGYWREIWLQRDVDRDG